MIIFVILEHEVLLTYFKPRKARQSNIASSAQNDMNQAYEDQNGIQYIEKWLIYNGICKENNISKD